MKGLVSLVKIKHEEIVKVFLNGKEIHSGCLKTLIEISEFRKLWRDSSSVKFIPYSIKQLLTIKCHTPLVLWEALFTIFRYMYLMTMLKLY